MKKSIDLDKLFSKKVLFILPVLFCLAFFSSFFNVNYKLFLRGSFEILYSEVLFCSFIYFILLSIVYLLAYKRTSKYNLFFIEMLLLFLTFRLSLVVKIIAIILCLLGIFFKEEVKKIITFLVSYVILCTFIINFIPATFRNIVFSFNVKDSNIKKEIVVDNKIEDGPNIYWIHCYGMVSLGTAEKYFNVDGTYLKDYFNTNNYYYNDDAKLVAAHHTMQALVAMYNPYYYDKFFGKYLNTLEETYYDDKAKVSYYVDYSELLDRRLNNELFDALNKGGYEIATITEFNQYSGFYADYIYDYNNMNVDPKEELELRYFSKSNTTRNMIDNYLTLEHFEAIGGKTIFNDLIDNSSVLNYEVLDYKNYDYSNYKYIDNTQFWKAKAIYRSLEHLNNQTSNKRFIFIDYAMSHAPWAYEVDGSFRKEYNSKEALLTTYTHSMYVLTDLLDYIRNNDPNAVIVLQADHGIHYVSSVPFEGMNEYFGVLEDEMRILRNSTMNAIYIPEEYRTVDDEVLGNPLNISRYLVNNYIGDNYKYVE